MAEISRKEARTAKAPGGADAAARLDSGASIRHRAMLVRLVELTLPVFTFVLGSVFTLVVQDSKERRAIKTESVREVVRLSGDWYNQVHRLSLVKQGGDNSEQFYETGIADYVNNRVILPDFLLHVHVIKGFPDCERLVEETEAFLSYGNRLLAPSRQNNGFDG